MFLKAYAEGRSQDFTIKLTIPNLTNFQGLTRPVVNMFHITKLGSKRKSTFS